MKATYIHGPGIDEPLMMNREGSNYFYHTDGLGSVVGLSNDLGEIEQQYLYTSFGGMTVFNKEGSEIQLIDGIKNPYGYTGREMDTESDLYYYRARYYNPNTGRFLTQDPIGFAGGDTNLYRYVNNNPISYIDPLGLFSWSETKKALRTIVKGGVQVQGGSAIVGVGVGVGTSITALSGGVATVGGVLIGGSIAGAGLISVDMGLKNLDQGIYDLLYKGLEIDPNFKLRDLLIPNSNAYEGQQCRLN